MPDAIQPHPTLSSLLLFSGRLSSAMSNPSMDQFAKVLYKEPDWYSFGVFLGAPSHELDTIGENYSKISVTRCLIEVYKCLEKLGKAPSWDFIASNLREMGNNLLAERIDSTYIHPSTEPPSESSSSNGLSEQSGAGIPDSVDQTSRAPEVMVPPEVPKQYISLLRRLTKLTLIIKDVFAATSSVKLEDVQHVIKRHWGIEPYAGSEATWEKVFHRLDEEHSMFDDPHVLSVIIDTFLPDNQVCSRQMKRFEKAVNSFKSSAKMCYLVDLLKKKKCETSKSQIIRLKVQERWSHCKIKNFETAMKMLLGSLYRHLSYLSVETGCYCISWIIGADFRHASQLLPKHSKELFKIIGIISLQIGEEMVYDSTGEVPGCEVLEAAMLQAIELKNARAIELLLAVGCSPEVATFNGNHAVTNIVNIRERSVDDGSGGGVDHVCVLGHNEVIIDPCTGVPKCSTCGIKEYQIERLQMQVDTLQLEIKKLRDTQKGITICYLTIFINYFF